MSNKNQLGQPTPPEKLGNPTDGMEGIRKQIDGVEKAISRFSTAYEQASVSAETSDGIRLRRESNDRIFINVGAIAAVALSLLTLPLLLAAAFQAYVARQTLVSDDRAWLAPENFQITLPSDGSPLTISGDTKNIGKEPASEVLFDNSPEGGFVRTPDFAKHTFPVPTDDRCSGSNEWTAKSKIGTTGPSFGNTIFPDQQLEFKQSGLIPSEKVAQANEQIDSGDYMYYFKSCVGYMTFKQHHHTAFCFYMLRDPDTKKRVTYHCPLGNDAK